MLVYVYDIRVFVSSSFCFVFSFFQLSNEPSTCSICFLVMLCDRTLLHGILLLHLDVFVNWTSTGTEYYLHCKYGDIPIIFYVLFTLDVLFETGKQCNGTHRMYVTLRQIFRTLANSIQRSYSL